MNHPACDFKIKEVKDINKNISKQNKQKYREKDQVYASIETFFNILKGALLEVTDWSCGHLMQLDIGEHDGGMMMMFVTDSVNKSKQRETQARRCI